jgi:cytochrome c-type biogenesis protein
MIQELFETLTGAFEGSSAIAIGAAFIWGILSILLSPCHLASIPLIMGFIGRQGDISTKKAFAISTVFSVGILLSIAAVGLVTAMAGRILGDLGPMTNYIVAGLFFVFGLVLLDVIKLPWSAPGQIDVKTKGLPAALMLGLIFGIATGPCTFAYMAPMLAVTFGLASTNLGLSIMLLAMYGLGHCLVIIIAGTSTELVQKYMNWNQESKGAYVMRKTCGILLFAAAGYLIYTA